MPPVDADAIVDIFNEQFQSLAGEAVMLYGLGQISRILVRHRKRLVFDIVGLLDRDQETGQWEGLPIHRLDEAPRLAGHLIITAALIYAWEIYRRVATLESRGVRIYFPNGRCYSEKPAGACLEKPHGPLFQKIQNAEVISFDIFDTLIIRRCLIPEAVFDLMEARLALPGLAAKRRQAADLCLQEGLVNYSLDDLYALGTARGLWPVDQRQLKRAELALELELTSPREDVRPAFEYAKALGRPIILVSDMYLSAEEIAVLLAKNQLTGFDEIYVSSQGRGAKGDGGLWLQIMNRYRGRRILHIGDNCLVDHFLTRGCGVDTHCLTTPLELLSVLGLDDWPAAERSPSAWLALGLFAHRFSRLAAAPDQPDKPGPAADFGYLVFGALTLFYAWWVLTTALKNGHGPLLFFSRDGYILLKIYNKLKAAFFPEGPEGLYFWVSKRAIFSALADDRQDLAECLRVLFTPQSTRNLTIAAWLSENLNCDPAPDSFNQRPAALSSAEEMLDYLSSLPELAQRAAVLRRNYQTYLGRLNLTGADRPAGVDFHSYQFSFLALERFSGFPLDMYLYGCAPAEEIFRAKDPERSRISAVHLDRFTTATFTGGNYPLSANSLCNAFFSAPTGSLSCFDDQGRPVLADEGDGGPERTELIQMQAGAEQFADDFLALGLAPDSDLDAVANACFSVAFSTCLRPPQSLRHLTGTGAL